MSQNIGKEEEEDSAAGSYMYCFSLATPVAMWGHCSVRNDTRPLNERRLENTADSVHLQEPE